MKWTTDSLASTNFKHHHFAMNTPPPPSSPDTKDENPHPLDPRIVDALDELGISYQSDPEGIFYMRFDFNDDRSQQVCIRSSTLEFLGVEMREIFSVGLISEGMFDARTSNFLLRENLQKISEPGPFFTATKPKRPSTRRRCPPRCLPECFSKS